MVDIYAEDFKRMETGDVEEVLNVLKKKLRCCCDASTFASCYFLDQSGKVGIAVISNIMCRRPNKDLVVFWKDEDFFYWSEVDMDPFMKKGWEPKKIILQESSIEVEFCTDGLIENMTITRGNRIF